MHVGLASSEHIAIVFYSVRLNNTTGEVLFK